VRDQLFLGIDGGGTKTAAWLGSRSPTETGALRVVGRGASGPSNPRTIGFEAAFGNLRAAISNAFEMAGLPMGPVEDACLCIAGAGRPSEQERLSKWIETESIARRYRLAMDVEAVLAAVPKVPESTGGIALIAGTGSIAWGKNRQGHTARCGGWGPLLGDEGSGYAIAIQGLQATCRAADGRCQDSALLAAFLRTLDCARPEQLIEWIYDPQTKREEIASLSQVVFECATHDETATRIVQQAARELGLAIRTVAAKLRLNQDAYHLALAGGVLCHHREFVDWVLQSLRENKQEPAQWQLVEQPVVGALQIAGQLTAEV
jgi:N-acetylglucosamine kinase-like BadF-type ATPase